MHADPDRYQFQANKKGDKVDFPRKLQYAFQITKILKTYHTLDTDEKEKTVFNV